MSFSTLASRHLLPPARTHGPNKTAPTAKHKNAAIPNPTACTSPIKTLPDENIQPKNCNPAPCPMYFSKTMPKLKAKRTQQTPAIRNIALFMG